MGLFLAIVVGVLAFANGANDNFKGVATLWGAGRTSYRWALAWATVMTLAGSLVAVSLASGLAAKFNGSTLVTAGIYSQPAFLVAVVFGAAATVLVASRVGLPISTTHALTGALVGSSIVATGIGGVAFASLGSGVIMPLLFSPLVAVGLTVAAYPLAARLARGRDCVCVDEKPAVSLSPSGEAAATVATPALRWASATECATGRELLRWRISDSLHWFSAAAISFARGLNDTPKIAAALLVISPAMGPSSVVLVALAMAVGGLLGAARVARTMSKQITPMAGEEAVGANLVAAGLVTLASLWALPVSTTHVTSGGIFGIGLRRRKEANWRRMREIVLAWVVTLPMGALLAALAYVFLMP